MNRENLEKREMGFLIGGNECSHGVSNQIINNYSENVHASVKVGIMKVLLIFQEMQFI